MLIDLAEWASDHLEGARASGSECQARCPWCGGDDRFYLHTADDEKAGSWVCFKSRCGERGRGLRGFVRLLAQVEGLTTKEAHDKVFGRAAVARRGDTPEGLLDRLAALRPARALAPIAPVGARVEVDLPEDFVPVHDAATGKWSFPTYLRERGVARATAAAWGMGFCRSGRYRGRVVIPIRCPNGYSFTGRDCTGAREPRYLNPKDADHGMLLCGWDLARPGADLVLCEGPLDAVALWQHGFPAVASMGNRLRPAQAALLMTWPRDATITVMLDPTEVESPYDAARQLLARWPMVKVARLAGTGPDGGKLDPGNATRAQVVAALDGAERFKGARTAGLMARWAVGLK